MDGGRFTDVSEFLKTLMNGAIDRGARSFGGHIVA
jgi:hypothetical protein